MKWKIVGFLGIMTLTLFSISILTIGQCNNTSCQPSDISIITGYFALGLAFPLSILADFGNYIQPQLLKVEWNIIRIIITILGIILTIIYHYLIATIIIKIMKRKQTKAKE